RPSGDANETDAVIARGAGVEPARTGQIGADRTAECAPVRITAEQRAIVDGLESERLVVLLKQSFNFGDRRAGARREHQFSRLVKGDAAEARKIEREIGLTWPADRALGPLPRKLKRLFVAERPAHGVLDFPGVARFQVI